MISSYLKIRACQLRRIVITIGIVRSLFLATLIAALECLISIRIDDSNSAALFSGLVVILIGSIHLKRGDYTFLKIVSNNYRLLFITDYLILSLPILIPLLFKGELTVVGAHLALIAVIALAPQFKFPEINRGSILIRVLPSYAIEWIAGVRRFHIIIIVISILGLLFSYMYACSILVIFVLGLIVTSFNEREEPYQFIILFEKKSSDLLNFKLKTQITLFTLLVLPQIIMFMVFHIERWYVVSIEYIVFCSILILTIVMKYSNVTHKPTFRAPNVMAFIGMGCALSVVLLPITWIVIYLSYSRAINSLNFYLDDFN